MRRLSAGLLTASLLAGFAGSASAQEPVEFQAPTAGAGQRLEFDEPGFAVTVPDDWEIELRRSEIEGQTVWARAGTDVGEPSEQSCSFSTGGISAARMGARSWAESTPLLEWLNLPGGRALVFEDPPEPPWPRHRYFIFDRGANSYQIYCFATELPEDRWLSIAATFEFLSDDPRVVRVHPGVTITFPIEWNVLEDRGQLAGVPAWEKVLWSTDGEAICRVSYDTRATDPEQERTTEELRAEFRDYLKLSAARTAGILVVDLPVGPAWRADWKAGPDGPYRIDRSLYQVSTGETSLRVACHTSGARPDDDWLSIVETIEFLPAEE